MNKTKFRHFGFLLLITLGLAGPILFAQSVLDQRDFDTTTKCPEGMSWNDCRTLKDKNAVVDCPTNTAYAGFRNSDNKFHVWCEPPLNAVAVKKVQCPEGTSIRAGHRYTLPSDLLLWCVTPSGELNGPFRKWSSPDPVTVGEYKAGKPVGVWRIEDVRGKVLAKGQMAYVGESVDSGERNGKWTVWSAEKGDYVSQYYVCGDGPFTEAEYLKYLKERPQRAKICGQ